MGIIRSDFLTYCDNFVFAKHAKGEGAKSVTIECKWSAKTNKKIHLSQNWTRHTRWSHIIDFKSMCQIKYLFVKYLP